MTDTPQSAWMREYKRLANAYAHTARVAHYSWGEGSQGDKDDAERSARTDLDAHVRVLVDALEEIAGLHAHHAVWLDGCSMANDMGHIAINALAAPKDAP